MVHAMRVESDADFIEQMIPHHQEALDTSNWIVAHTANVQLKDFARNIVRVQQAEIQQMNGLYQSLYQKPVPKRDYMPMMPMTVDSRYDGHKSDTAYVQGMIGHHQGAVDMAQQLNALTTNPMLRQMGEAVVQAQTAEIIWMQKWLQKNPLAADGHAHQH
jgi:uncharacterized protein (DUF305 family)